MATISKVTVKGARQIDAANWLAVRDVKGKNAVPTSLPGGDCVVQVTTAPHNNAAEWKQIVWNGGKPVPGSPNQRKVGRGTTGVTEVEASLGTSRQKVAVWVMWADMQILTSGPRPAGAMPWSKGALLSGPDRCGAFEVESLSMGKNARGQIVAVAQLFPAGVGKLIGKQYTSFKIRRQLTAHDFADGQRAKSKKTFVDWADDTLAAMQVLSTAVSDKLYDSDAPDLPLGSTSSETYNNFRQWLDWDGKPCSGYAYWHFQARWKDQKVTLKEVDGGVIKLPSQPFYK